MKLLNKIVQSFVYSTKTSGRTATYCLCHWRETTAQESMQVFSGDQSYETQLLSCVMGIALHQLLNSGSVPLPPCEQDR